MESFPSNVPSPSPEEGLETKSYEERLAIIRGLEAGDVLNSKSGTYRTLLSKGDGIYTFEKAGADGTKSVQSINEDDLIIGLGAVSHIEKKQ